MKPSLIGSLLASLMLCAWQAPFEAAPSPFKSLAQSLAFRDVRVFDGERTIERATVLVKDREH